ncbi:hypothetical protein [Frankia sp. CiP1_Cm_nod2]|uniref:hypothetical protein n=1 Tax=Frankia sp. CiP1_Cm_nod2 TaxID=2897161 RepID=UPI00202431FB
MTTPILPDFPPVDPAFVEPTIADLTEASGRVAQYGPNTVRTTAFMLATDALTAALTSGSMAEVLRAVRQMVAVDRAVIAYQRGELITGEADGLDDDVATVPGVLDGFACLVCGADLTVPGVASVPAGAVGECQVFACSAHGQDRDGGPAAVTR